MKIIIFVLFTMVISSCTVQFTSKMKDELESSNIDLKKIQFYNSHSFALQRELASSETGIEKGKIKTQEGKRVEIVNFPLKKPAICDSVSDNTLFILFEYGENKRIPFVSDSDNECYSLVTPGSIDTPLDIKDYTRAGYKFYGTIKYDGKDYYYGYSKKPKLKVKKNQVEKVLRESRAVKGIRIN